MLPTAAKTPFPWSSWKTIATSGAFEITKGGEKNASWRWNRSNRNGPNDRTRSWLLRGQQCSRIHKPVPKEASLELQRQCGAYTKACISPIDVLWSPATLFFWGFGTEMWTRPWKRPGTWETMVLVIRDLEDGVNESLQKYSFDVIYGKS